VWVPKSKLAPWIRFYKSIKASKPNQFVTFTSYEEILQADDPVAVFNSYFIEAGERTIPMSDVASALKEKLGKSSRATSFEYHLTKQLHLLPESNGVKFIGIFHNFDSNLRPHFQDVFSSTVPSTTMTTTRSYDFFLSWDVPLSSCMQFVMDLGSAGDKPQYGTWHTP
jgi:hypothetical protein